MDEYTRYMLDLAARLDSLRKEFIDATTQETDVVETDRSTRSATILYDEAMLQTVNYIKTVAQRHQARIELGKALTK